MTQTPTPQSTTAVTQGASYIARLTSLLMFVMHGALFSFETTMMSIMLLLTTDEMQGRVQGIYALVFGFTWLGGVALGAIAEWTNAPLAIGLVLIVLWRPLTQIQVAADS